MHMASALISAGVAGTMGTGSMGALVYTGSKYREEQQHKAVLMAAAGAAVFAAQMVNFTITGTGSSGHFAGGFLLASLLGATPAYIVMSIVLLVQSLFFADGGLLALGCNVFNMAVIPCLIVYPVVSKYVLHRTKKVTGFILGGTIAVLLGAFAVVLETVVSGASGLDVRALVWNMLGIHFVIGIVEGVLSFGLYSVYHSCNKKKEVYGIGFMAAVAMVASTVLSVFASANPDGLEWSLLKASTNAAVSQSAIHTLFDTIQNTTTLFPEYAIEALQSVFSTSCAGLIGCFIVFIVALVVGKVICKKSASMAV